MLEDGAVELARVICMGERACRIVVVGDGADRTLLILENEA